MNCFPCSDKISQRYDHGQCEIETRPAGYNRLIGFHCSLELTDILDTAEAGEIAAAITDGTIVLSPMHGNFELNQGTSESFVDGCGIKFAGPTEASWTYRTPSANPDYLDEDWWYQFHKDSNNWTWGWMNCEGRVVLNDKTVAAIKESQGGVAGPVAVQNPGFVLSLNNIPAFLPENGGGKAGVWTLSGTLIHSHVFRSVAIPGLEALLRGNG